jgi:prevent-host-death family protein
MPGYNSVTISGLRKDTLGVLKKTARSAEPIVIISNSMPVGAIISMSLYARIQNAEPAIDQKLYKKGLSLFTDTSKKPLSKKKRFDAVELIRKDREEWIDSL